MPTLTFTSASGVQTIGPLAAGTDFQVLDGACVFSTAAFGSNNLGFQRVGGEIFYVAEGKTVYLKTTRKCAIHYEALE